MAEIEGWLQKAGGMNGKSNQKRYFVLKGPALYYYKDKPANDNAKEQGSMDLADTTIEEKGNNAWSIFGGKLTKTYVLTAANEAERNEWLGKMRPAQSMSDVGITVQESVVVQFADGEGSEKNSKQNSGRNSATGEVEEEAKEETHAKEREAKVEEKTRTEGEPKEEKRAEEQRAEIEGWLQKAGGMNGKSNQKRYFVLKSPALYYYKDKPANDNAKEQGSIDLADTTIEEKGNNAWSIFGGKLTKTYVLTAANEAERDEWLGKMRPAQVITVQESVVVQESVADGEGSEKNSKQNSGRNSAAGEVEEEAKEREAKVEEEKRAEEEPKKKEEGGCCIVM